MTVGCLEESTVIAFLGGRLRHDERGNVERHVATCSACADLVTWTAADQASVTRLPGHEGRPFVGELHPGARIGRYQILGALGRGGMGEVYAAYHPDLDRRIALKVVAGAGNDTGERRVRLLREARAIARLSHPNVVAVHDAGTFGDRVFIAMELIDGATVDEWLRAAPRTWRQIVDVFMAAGRGLAAAHAADVIHRDFKPHNVMIARNGAVRVMDFGLARLTTEPTDGAGRADEDDPTIGLAASVTKTGAFVGTPAYMSPEQFRREPIDARSDQFSFCVALHEALFGSRPVGAVAGDGNGTVAVSGTRPRTVAPSWLRAVVLRGAAPDREERFPSTNALLGALDRGRGRTRRRVSVAAALAATFMLSAGTWRVAHGNRMACTPPEERIGRAWASAAADARRQSIHRAFVVTGRSTAETSWERVSKVLDEYMSAWRTMYQETCEATHIRGEQSTEVLDLRMSCLNDDLDQVRAVTDALVAADGEILSNVVTAASGLTPVSRCANIPLLRSAVPLPRNERTLHDVQQLRRELAEIQTLFDLGKLAQALPKALSVRAAAEATGYKPVLAAASTSVGLLLAEVAPARAERFLEEAVFVAEGSGDDETAALAASTLAYSIGFQLSRRREGERWASLSHAFVERLGSGHSRVRAWTSENEAAIKWSYGEFEASRVLLERAIDLLRSEYGDDHPDVAGASSSLAFMLLSLGRYEDALHTADRAIAIYREHGDPDNARLGNAIYNRGEALRALGRLHEARVAFQNSLEIAAGSGPAAEPMLGDPLTGLAEIDIAEGNPRAAIPLLERALRVRAPGTMQELFVADTQFALARAFVLARGNRHRAHSLAVAARDVYVRHGHVEQQRLVDKWLREWAAAI